MSGFFSYEMTNDYLKLTFRLTVVCVHRYTVSLRGPIENHVSPSLSSTSSDDALGACRNN